MASYVYDDAGNRVQETVNGTTTYYLTDNANPTGYAQPLEQKASPTATPTETYLIGDRVFGQVNASSVVSYLLADGHGSTEQITSSTGSVTTAFRYDAFGGGINFTLATAPTIFLFGGDAVYDPASGLYLHGDGVRGRSGFRFIEADVENNGSMSDPLSLHKYLYSLANPLNSNDPTGRYTQADGYEAEYEIEEIYEEDRPDNDADFGRYLYPLPIKPDILDYKYDEFFEIKPLSPYGLTTGPIQMATYATTLSIAGFKPGASWTPSRNDIEIGGEPAFFFNVGGLIFYTDAVEASEELIGIATIGLLKATLAANPQILNSAVSILSQVGQKIGIASRTVPTFEEADAEDTSGIADILGMFGGGL